ncbi:MAG: IclR family transcriptional regulator [Bordetella sp.]|nr:IclR family transcriptional regulator [Bordetella sp.]
MAAIPICWTTPVSADKPAYEVPALARAHALLSRLAERGAPMRAAELARDSGMPRSSLYLLLETLEARRWIERAGDGYVIGLTLLSLGSAYLRHDNLEPAFRDAAADFVARHNEVMQLAMLDGADVAYLAREDARRPVRLVTDPGSRLPAHACALGKALLASLSDAEVLARLPSPLPAITDRTITDPARLLAELATARRTGFALDLEEVSAGLTCYAAYVGRTPLGRRVAVSTSLPADRLDPRHADAVRAGLIAAARQIALRATAEEPPAP